MCLARRCQRRDKGQLQGKRGGEGGTKRGEYKNRTEGGGDGWAEGLDVKGLP